MHIRAIVLSAFLVALTGAVTFTAIPQSAARGMMGMGMGGSPTNGLSGDADHGKTIADQTCAACHGPDGHSTNPQYPNLAGQSADYLDVQLAAFADGSRPSDIMTSIAKALSSQDMADVADYYSLQKPKPDTVDDKQAVELGRQIFLNGTSGAPACAMCHSASGGGMPMMGHGGMMGMMGSGRIPKLDAQHAAYLVDQLNRYADGVRPSQQMGSIAAALSPDQRKDVADYLAGTP